MSGQAERAKYHVTLGSLIGALDQLPDDNFVSFEDGLYPGHFESYRGYYDDLAIVPQSEPQHVGALRKLAVAARGSVFEGYKGGHYQMTNGTPLWRAEYGRTGPAIIELRKLFVGTLMLVTREVD